MSTGALSDAEFAAAVNSGGASRRLRDNTPGPASGYFVSTPRHARKLTGPTTTAEVADHKAEIVAAGHLQPEDYQGGWPPHGATPGALDHSQRHTNEHVSVGLATLYKQDAVYDAGRDRDIILPKPHPTGDPLQRFLAGSLASVNAARAARNSARAGQGSGEK